MRRSLVSVSAVTANVVVTTAAAVTVGLASAPAALAERPWGINGTYSAVSNGEWAKTNDKLEARPNVFDTWTISTTCTNVVTCSGTVTSAEGWTAPIKTVSGIWNVVRDIPNWVPCTVGPAATGHQVYSFWRAADDGWQDMNSDILAGSNKTVADSGNCGVNRPVVIQMPFKLRPV